MLLFMTVSWQIHSCTLLRHPGGIVGKLSMIPDSGFGIIPMILSAAPVLAVLPRTPTAFKIQLNMIGHHHNTASMIVESAPLHSDPHASSKSQQAVVLVICLRRIACERSVDVTSTILGWCSTRWVSLLPL